MDKGDMLTGSNKPRERSRRITPLWKGVWAIVWFGSVNSRFWIQWRGDNLALLWSLWRRVICGGSFEWMGGSLWDILKRKGLLTSNIFYFYFVHLFYVFIYYGGGGLFFRRHFSCNNFYFLLFRANQCQLSLSQSFSEKCNHSYEI